MSRPLSFLSFFLFSVVFSRAVDVPVSKVPVSSPDDIRFVVMPDRTGGMRAGVFRDALAKANLLHPEFLISVGDLIDGYTLDESLLDAQWKEFDAMVDGLDVPFYYVPGNHDISNLWMEEQWRKRLGDPYYSFVYKDVLFLSLHTEDGGKSGISEEQGRYFEQVLAEHSDVRWIFLFMHRPLWSYGNQEGFERIGEALQGRRYTLLSGHHHNYYYESDTDGNERLILGTAGGGSYLRGEQFGEFDHVTHVVLTADGPKITHLKLDGFVDKAVVNKDNRGRVEVLRSGGFAKVTPAVANRPVVAGLGGTILITNADTSVLEVGLLYPEVDGVVFECDSDVFAVAGGKSLEIPFTMKAASGGEVRLDKLPELFVEIEGIYGRGANSELRLPTRKLWRVDWNRRMARDDAASWNWESLDPPGYLTEGWDWRGREDCLIRFALNKLDRSLVLRVEIEDDVWLFLDGKLSDRLRLYFDAGAGEKVLDFIPNEAGELLAPAGFSGEASFVQGEGKLVFKIDIPYEEIGLKAESTAVRFNLRYLDHDRPENQKPSSLYWKPLWGSEEDYEASGRFEISSQ